MIGTKRIMVTGAGGPAGINFIKSLRRATETFRITGIDINQYHLEWLNKLCEERYIVPEYTAPNYLDKLNELIRKTKTELVHPQPDGEVAVLSENREKVEAMLYLPSKETVRICQDKFESGKIWKAAGLPVADTMFIETEEDMLRAAETFGYPYWLRASKGFSSRGSTLVTNIDTAKHWIGYWRSRGCEWKFIAQEYLPGDNIAFQSIWKDGELVTSQARKRLEYIYPYLAPSGCTNTPIVAVTIHRDDVNKMATDAVLSIDRHATGIFCVDLKCDKKNNPWPTEINAGRFFTTSYFFTRAGVNMPYIYAKLAFGESIPKARQYNALPEGLHWIRHIDAPAVLVREGKFKCSTI